MKKPRTIFLMEDEVGERALSLAHSVGLEINPTIVSDLDSLLAAFDETYDLLLSFGVGVIVPRHILETPGLIALNVHAASPEFPGRDPHHFAVYYGAKEYGATLHHMIDKVDQGTIIDVELFPVPEEVQPVDLLEKANLAGFELIRRLFWDFSNSGIERFLPKNPNISWAARKFTRKDFLNLCRVDSSMTQEEFCRRLKASSMPGYNNLYTEIHGFRFYINEFA